MAALDFPASSSSPWTAPNGVIYTWNADGYWEAKADPNDFDTDYLKLNATNDPVTGNLALNQDLDVGDNLAVTGTSDFTGDVSAAANLAVTGTSDFTGLTTHEAGISVTGGGIDGNTSNIFKAVSSSSQVNPFIISTNDNVGVSITSPGAVNVYGTTYRQTSGNPAYRFQIGTGGFHPTSTNQTACFVKSDFTTNQPTAGGAYSHFVVSSQAGGTHQGELNGFYCGSISQGVSNTAGTKVIGFKSDIDNDGAKPNIEAYNFYAAGDAPNYFAGESSFFTTDETDTAYLGIIKNSANRGSLWAHTGNVLLGANPDQDLVTAGGTNATRLSYFQSQFSSNFNDLTTPGVQFIRSGGDSTEAARAIEFYRYSAYSGAIMVSSTDVAFAPSGDYRLKSNIVDLPSSADLIKQLKPRKYTIKGVPNKIGFVAHELQEVVPEAVFGTKDATEAIGTFADYDGTELETDVVEPPAEELTYTEEVETDGVVTMVTRARTWTPTGTRPVYQGVDQTKLIPLLVKSLQEALERIEALEAQLNP